MLRQLVRHGLKKHDESVPRFVATYGSRKRAWAHQNKARQLANQFLGSDSRFRGLRPQRARQLAKQTLNRKKNSICSLPAYLRFFLHLKNFGLPSWLFLFLWLAWLGVSRVSSLAVSMSMMSSRISFAAFCDRHHTYVDSLV